MILRDDIIEEVAKILGDAATGSEISRFFADCGLFDGSGESTKWKRIAFVLKLRQRHDGTWNKIHEFILKVMSPVRFASNASEFEILRGQLNRVLSFAGLELTKSGKICQVDPSQTLDEAAKKAIGLYRKLQERGAHSEVFKYCTRELLCEDEFHAVIEAVQGLMQRIRDMSGCGADGCSLIDAVFGGNHPCLCLNTMQTAEDEAEHKGFMALLKGCYQMARNPKCHTARILWKGDADVLDSFALVSMLHRGLDRCVRTR